MSKEPNLKYITGAYGSQQLFNDNWDEIKKALKNTISRDGSNPNHMDADLDLNSYDLLNVGLMDADALRVGGERLVSSSVFFDWQGTWATGTHYGLHAIVHHDKDAYIAVQEHTSGTFNTDLANGYWSLFAKGGADGPGGLGDMMAANNLSDVSDTSAAVSNLGLDKAIKEPAGSVAGDILYYDGTEYVKLPLGGEGRVLSSWPAGNNVYWEVRSPIHAAVGGDIYVDQNPLSQLTLINLDTAYGGEDIIFMIQLTDIKLSDAGAGVLVQYSTDNGATWVRNGYKGRAWSEVAVNNTTYGGLLAYNLSNDVGKDGYSGMLTIHNMLKPNTRVVAHSEGVQSIQGSPDYASVQGHGVYETPTKFNALRITPTDGLMTGGRIRVFKTFF